MEAGGRGAKERGAEKSYRRKAEEKGEEERQRREVKKKLLHWSLDRTPPFHRPPPTLESEQYHVSKPAIATPSSQRSHIPLDRRVSDPSLNVLARRPDSMRHSVAIIYHQKSTKVRV
jgi:hypothetical protein